MESFTKSPQKSPEKKLKSNNAYHTVTVEDSLANLAKTHATLDEFLVERLPQIKKASIGNSGSAIAIRNLS